MASEGFHEPLELLDEASVDHHRAMTSLCEELGGDRLVRPTGEGNLG